MKTPFKLLFTVCLFAFGTTLQAQFLDKLKNKVEKKVEQTVINKTADKAAQKTSKTMDKVIDPNLGGGKKVKKVTPQNVPDSFEFEYLYRLTMTTKEGTMDIDYHLKPGATYMGSKMSTGLEMFMIMDGHENITYMFVESGGNKIATATSIDLSEVPEDDEIDMNSFTITDLPNKTYLGYDCIGKKMENDDYTFIMYFTPDGPVSFNDVFPSNSDQFPPALRNQMQQYEGSLMMYMDMKDKKNKKKKNTSGTMECTIIEKNSFNFSTKGYTFM